MAGRKDIGRASGSDDRASLSLQLVRPCPLCNELMEFDPQSSPQVVVCDACGLACTIDAPPARPEVLELEVLPEAPPVAEDGDDVVQWLQRSPGPILPNPDFAAKQVAARRRQLALAGGVAGSAALAIALLSGYFGYHQASDEFDAGWDMTGAAQEGRVAYELGRELANSARWPSWLDGVEYKTVRERSAAARTTP